MPSDDEDEHDDEDDDDNGALKNTDKQKIQKQNTNT
jgi:hypothetical protein